MDFFEQQNRAERQTKLLHVYFCLAVLLALTLTYLASATVVLPFLKPLPHASRKLPFILSIFWLLGEIILHPGYCLRWAWEPQFAAGFAVIAGLSIAAGSFYKIRQLAAGGQAVAALLGGRRLEPDPSDADEQKLRHVVEEMAVASGTPVPEIYVLDQERGINAFAAGHTRSDVAVAVTRGCLKLLNRDEIQGVIAHEFSHILRGDTRLNMRLMGIVHGLLWPYIVGRVLLRGSDRAGYLGESIFDQEASVTRLPFMLLGYILMWLGSIGLPFVRLIKSAICREREWLADAAAVEFTRYPPGIAGALKKIGGLYKQGQLDTPHAETASHLYFANSSSAPWFSSLSTHPPLRNRILAIDPGFDGRFTKVSMLPPSQFERERMYEEAVGRALAAERTNADTVLSATGNPTVEHIRQAAAVRLGLPDKVSAAFRSPNGAMAIIYALLISNEETTGPGQLELLGRKVDFSLFQRVRELWAEAQALDPRVKLPLIDLSLPALRRLDPSQHREFTKNIEELIEYDRAIDLFEYTLKKILFRHLGFYYEPRAKTSSGTLTVSSLVPECAVLLSALAYLAQDDADVPSAFERGAGYLDAPAGSVQLLQGDARNLEQVDAALDRLAQASHVARRNVLLACAQTVAADGRVGYREAELLRAIAEALDCPIPPFVEALEAQSGES